MNKRSQSTPKQKHEESLVIPGQALRPSELLKRHLAGTLPPIDLSGKYEYHYDENGKQVGEPLPLELHTLHQLSVALRKRQYEEALIEKKKQAEKHRDDIISEYLKNEEAKRAAAELARSSTPTKGDTPA